MYLFMYMYGIWKAVDTTQVVSPALHIHIPRRGIKIYNNVRNTRDIIRMWKTEFKYFEIEST